MSLVKRNNLNFPLLINEMLKPDWFGGIENTVSRGPAVNIKESDTGYELELVVPGKQKEDFNIEIDKDVLTVSSEVKPEETSYTRREFVVSSFSRSFTLPETVQTEKIDANYENGILRFQLPKKEDALPKPKRLIEL